MDYPKSVPGVGLVDGQFVDEDQVTGTPGSLIPASWGNAVTDELRAVIEAAGLAPSEMDNAQLLAAIRLLGPTGQVATFAMSTPPVGWIKANGATVSRTTYADLFAKIGTTFGAGDGVTTFKIPDLRGEFIRGWDDGRGTDSGRALGSGQGYAIELHNHTLPTGSGSLDPNSGIWGVNDAYWEEITGPYLNTTPAINEFAITGSTGYMAYPATVAGNYANETRPRNVALLACIKY